MGGRRGNLGGGYAVAKPVVLHKLTGTYRKDRHAKRKEPPIKGDGRIPLPPPDHLADEVKEAYVELASTLQHRIFSEEDIHAFVVFASAWAQWKKVDDHVRKHGISYEHKGRQAFTVETRLWLTLNGQLLGFFSRYGMTPGDRARFYGESTSSNGGQENPDDEFAQDAANIKSA